MNKEEIIRMARKSGLKVCTNISGVTLVGAPLGDTPSIAHITIDEMARFAALVAAAERNKLAAWMIERGYATGHGDTTEDLLKEIDWQIEERIKNEREACAELVWPTQQFKVWSDEELTAMTGAFNRAQEKHGWYETIMAVGAVALKGRAAAIRARGETQYGREDK